MGGKDYRVSWDDKKIRMKIILIRIEEEVSKRFEVDECVES